VYTEESLNLIIEQGHEIKKDGRVMVQVSKRSDSYDVEITGTAVHVKDFDVCLED
jgi:predicted PhzF superfamily epimerase YddE/YHI9